MKRLFHMLLAPLAMFAAMAQGCWAEFGEQQTYPGLRAAADLNAWKYRFVRHTATIGYINTCSETAITSLGPLQALGVLQNNPRAEEAATVAFAGLSKVVVGNGGVTAGMFITHNQSAQAINAVSGSVVLGKSLDTVANAGEVATIMLFPPIRIGIVG